MPGDRRLFLLLLPLLALSGCGSDAPEPMTFTGPRVARLAEQQLESAHPALAPGTMTCSDLVFRVGARTRCARTSTLSRGREVRVLGTVRVTSTEDGGKLHVTLDKAAADFGLDGAWLAGQLRGWRKGRGESDADVDCPDLLGVVGRTVSCTADGRTVTAEVTGTEPATFDVRYRFSVG